MCIATRAARRTSLTHRTAIGQPGQLALSKNPDSHRRTKHIDVKYHLLREHVELGTVALPDGIGLQYCNSATPPFVRHSYENSVFIANTVILL